jgi:hypothetical protein
MPRYRVTVRRTSIEVVEAGNQFMAALAVRDQYGDGVEISDVAPAVGRPPTRSGRQAPRAKSVAKKRRPLSPETRAKLAKNLAKARAARAAKSKAAKRTRTTRVKRPAKKR